MKENRRKFISAAGRPVNLGANGSGPTGNQPIIYCPTGDGTNNLGYGGNFSANGSPTSIGFTADIKPDMAAQGRAIIIPGYGAAAEGEARMLIDSGMSGGAR